MGWLSSWAIGSGDFDQDAASACRIEEGGLFAHGAASRTRISHGKSELGEFGHRTGNILDSQTDVVQRLTVLPQVTLQRMIVTQRLDQLQVGVAQIQVREADALLVEHFAEQHDKPQDVTVKP
jgi:hypothetical protein